MDFTVARTNMIESQVRPNGITDKRILGAMSTIPRELFVPPEYRSLAYIDEDIEVAVMEEEKTPRYLMEPMAFARLVQLLSVEAQDTVLDVGSGTGYSTAILATLAAHATGLEADPGLCAKATANLSRLGVQNATIRMGKLASGLPDAGPFNAIFINGRVPEVPQELFEQLVDGGRLVAVVGQSEVAKAHLYARNGTTVSSTLAFDASIGALPGFSPRKPAFSF